MRKASLLGLASRQLDRLGRAKEMAHARPHLRTVAPLTSWIVVGFAVMNVLLGFGFHLLNAGRTASNLVIVRGFFSLEFWAAVFFLLGCAMFYAYFRNFWNLIKATLLIGLAIKATWMVALAFIVLNGGSITLMVIWSFLTYVQVLTYIYFVPRLRREDDPVGL